jgi:hypothetical protein
MAGFLRCCTPALQIFEVPFPAEVLESLWGWRFLGGYRTALCSGEDDAGAVLGRNLSLPRAESWPLWPLLVRAACS